MVALMDAIHDITHHTIPYIKESEKDNDITHQSTTSHIKATSHIKSRIRGYHFVHTSWYKFHFIVFHYYTFHIPILPVVALDAHIVLALQ